MGTRQEWGLLVLAVMMGLAGFFDGSLADSGKLHDWTCENPHLIVDSWQSETLSCTAEPPDSKNSKRIVGSDQLMLGSKMNLNEITELDLQVLPRIGPVLARRIVAFRKENGSFKSLDDLLDVKGIGQKTLARIRPFLRIDTVE